MDTIKCSLVRSSGRGPFLLVRKYASAPNEISSCCSSYMPLLIYVARDLLVHREGLLLCVRCCMLGSILRKIVSP